MNTYPVNLLLAGKRCLIVGGGKVAGRKLAALLKAGVLVSVVAPAPTRKIKTLAEAGKIELFTRKFKDQDLDSADIVFLATDDRELNRSVMLMAKAKGVMVCCVDANWRDGSFITPASVNHNDITIAVSSQGVACRKTKLIKENLSRHIDAIENTELLVIGTDHNHLKMDLRKDLHLSGKRLDKAGELVMTLLGVHEFMLLNTCNRVELIAAGHNNPAVIDMLKMVLKLNALEPGQYYVKTGFDAFRHMCLVTSGLFSQTPGENHISAQFKDACEYAKDKKWSGSLLKSLRDNILHVAKHIRTEIVSQLRVFEIEELAMEFIKSKISSLKGRRVMLGGTGVVGRALKELLLAEGCSIDWIYYSNPPEEKDPGVNIATLDSLDEKLLAADLVITAMSAEEPVISVEMLQRLKPEAVSVDLGVPGNIAGKPTADMEDLKHWHRRNNCNMNEILVQADRIIDEHKDVYERFRKSFIDGRQGQ
jgi:glutamyl-tRNA reductase